MGDMMVEKISVLGSTGSIGKKALKIADKLGILVKGLSVFNNISLLEDQIRCFKPEKVSVFDEDAAVKLRNNIKDCRTKVLAGIDGLCEVASLESVDTVLNSVSGMIGLRPTLCAIDARKNIALANKETLVAGGSLVMNKAREKGVSILPVDSEHSAIFQCLEGCHDKKSLQKLILTASGGPFFGKSINDLKNVTKKEALKHPNWSMGDKITIDSATMMNKGLEVIEAAWLFNVSPDDIEVLIHRESIVHSMIEYNDNSVIAQLGVPDMGIPIQYAFTYPDRLPSIVDKLDLSKIRNLSFCKPDNKIFKGIEICKSALKIGGTMPAIVNGANEEAVKLFLEDKISFLDISNTVEKAMNHFKSNSVASLDDILKADKEARIFVKENVFRQENKIC